MRPQEPGPTQTAPSKFPVVPVAIGAAALILVAVLTS